MKGWKDLGIRKVTDEGELKLVYGVPETKEIFVVRQLDKYEHKGEGFSVLFVRHFDRSTGKETPVSYAKFVEGKRNIFVEGLVTEDAYERRGAASALIAYLKTKRKPIELMTSGEGAGFYKKLGFNKKLWILGADRVLPAEKPLPMREFEKTGRKFVILAEPRPKPVRVKRTLLEKAKAAFGKARKAKPA